MAEQKKQSTLLSFEELLPEETKHNDAEDSGVQKDGGTSQEQETLHTEDMSNAINRLREQNAVKEELECLVKTCKNEQELLELRNKIIDREYENLKKGELLAALDDYVSNQISDTIQEAAALNDRKKEVNNLKLGVVVIVIAGFLLTGVFSYSFPIAIVLAIIGWFGADDRKKYEDSVKAVAIVEKYKNAGYQLKEK